jgi:hypothetical protein
MRRRESRCLRPSFPSASTQSPQESPSICNALNAVSCLTNNPSCPAPETEVCRPILNANDKGKLNSNVQSVCLSTMHGSYLQHLLVFSLIFCYRDTSNVVVELLIKCTAVELVSNCLIAETPDQEISCSQSTYYWSSIACFRCSTSCSQSPPTLGYRWISEIELYTGSVAGL